MPAQNPIVAYGDSDRHAELGQLGIPSIPVLQSGSPSAPVSNWYSNLYGTADLASGSNAAGTSENIAMHVAVLVVIALIGVFVFRGAGIRFAFAVGAGRG